MRRNLKVKPLPPYSEHMLQTPYKIHMLYSHHGYVNHTNRDRAGGHVSKSPSAWDRAYSKQDKKRVRQEAKQEIKIELEQEQ